MQRILHGADFQALEIVGLAHRPHAVGEMTEAVFAPGQRDQVVLGKQGQHLLPDRAIEHRPGVGVITEQEWDVGDQGFRHEVSDWAGGDEREVDRAFLRPFQQLALGAKGAVGVKLDAVAPPGAAGHGLGERRSAAAVMGTAGEGEAHFEHPLVEHRLGGGGARPAEQHYRRQDRQPPPQDHDRVPLPAGGCLGTYAG